MTITRAKDKDNKIFIKALLVIITYNYQNIFIVQATGVLCAFSGLYYKHITIVNDASRVTRMTNVSDGTSWSINYNCK